MYLILLRCLIKTNLLIAFIRIVRTRILNVLQTTLTALQYLLRKRHEILVDNSSKYVVLFLRKVIKVAFTVLTSTALLTLSFKSGIIIKIFFFNMIFLDCLY